MLKNLPTGLLSIGDAKVGAKKNGSRMLIVYFRLYSFVNVCKRV
jgi:hypothetical protein